MSLAIQGIFLPPSSSLPQVRTLLSATEDQITSALRNLQSLYCPLRLPASLPNPTVHRRRNLDIAPASTPIPVDSGYASQDDDDDDNDDDDEKDRAKDAEDAAEMVAALRADPFEKSFATRWLTTVLARAEEFTFEEDVKERIIDDAALVLASFSDSGNGEGDEALTREFEFPLGSEEGESIRVTLNDAPLSGTDHTDVGLQSWGASIVLSSMMCADRGRFGLDKLPEDASIIELGAGTGLISLTLGKLLPQLSSSSSSSSSSSFSSRSSSPETQNSQTPQTARTILATDYHPAVLANLHANITTNFPPTSSSSTPETDEETTDTNTPIQTSLLDWSRPPPSLASTASLLLAADVVYAPTHASWLRDCATHLLSQGPNHSFYLMVTVRQTGKFEGIADTVEAAFLDAKCPRDGEGRVFRILEKEFVRKRRGVGRGDESGYFLYRIGWVVE